MKSKNIKLNNLILFVLLFSILIVNPAYALQKIERKVLNNGMILLIMEQHALPFVTVNLSFKSGAVFDPAGKEGLSNLTASVLTRGTKNYTAQSLAQTIEFVGGSINSSAAVDFNEVALSVLTKDLDLGFKILSEVVTSPTFVQEEIDREKQETLGGIMQEKEDPSVVAYKKFSELVYGAHPYWHPVEGAENSIPKLTRQDIVGFYSKYYVPNNGLMVVVGDIDLVKLEGLLAKYFSDWNKKEIKLPVIAQPKPLEGKARELIDQKLTQSTILLGHTGISRSNPDFYEVYVMNYILGGGGFSSRLLKDIRDEKGLAYSAGSYFYPAYYGGSFMATIQTKNENTSQVVEAVLAEMKRIRTEFVADEELAAAKDYLTGSFPLKFDTNAKIASYLAYIENNNLGLNYIEEYPKKINAVTKEKILEAAKKYLNDEKYLLVVVADQKKAGLELSDKKGK